MSLREVQITHTPGHSHEPQTTHASTLEQDTATLTPMESMARGAQEQAAQPHELSEPDLRELALLRLLMELGEQLEDTRDTDKALRSALRLGREHFGAAQACIATIPPGAREAERLFALPPEAPFDAPLYTAFLQGERRALPRETLFAPIRRRGRLWATFGFTRSDGTFDRESLREVARLSSAVSKEVQRIDLLRTAEVRARIDRKIMEQLRPKDLFYQILHGLRSLTHYDHSAAVLIADEASGELELVAEQVAWRKGKSARIGTKIALDDEIRGLLESGEVYGFEREDGGWSAWRRSEATPLAQVLDFDAPEPEGSPAREGSMLCAPLATREGVLGVIKVAARQAGIFGPYEADLVQRFRPQASVAIRNLRRAASLETSVLEAEKKNALANLARGVSHDVNNAFGSVLPLLQQLLADARAGRLEPEVLLPDLEQIESSLQICRRIFSGMLGFARTSARSIGAGNLRRAVETTLSLLRDGMLRQGIVVVTDVPEELPHVNGTQSELEQLVLNLATNARDAMPEGGLLRVAAQSLAQRPAGGVRLVLSDTGTGIAPTDLSRIREPFYTTKPEGSGLGLAICRSILWKMGGRMDIVSELGHGTCVQLDLPASGSVRLAAQMADDERAAEA